MGLTTAVAAAIPATPRRLELPLVAVLWPVALEKAGGVPSRGDPKDGENGHGGHLGTVPPAIGVVLRGAGPDRLRQNGGESSESLSSP
jgi:hypothetical protein